MIERLIRLPQSYGEALEEFGFKLGEYEKAKAQSEQLLKQIREKYQELAQLRERKLEQLLDEQGLGICCAELDKDEFIKQHKNVFGLGKLGQLGIFPLEKLNFVYFQTYVYCKGGDYEESSWGTKQEIYHLCDFHTKSDPREVFRSIPQHWRLENWGWVIRVSQQKNGTFLDHNGNIYARPFYQSKYFSPPESIFQHFQIPPLLDKYKIR